MKNIFLSAFVLGLISCQNCRITKDTYEGFKWNRVSGPGITLLTQSNEKIKLMADPSLPGIVMVKDSSAKPKKLIQIFNLRNKDINDVLDILQEEGSWDYNQTCRFKEIKSNDKNTIRYILIPDGKYAEVMNEKMKNEPVPYTCNGWGIGNSGQRYFEIHKNAPDKAVFVEIGQEKPLFNEKSIKLTKTQKEDSISKDILYTINGILRIGHEVRSFKPNTSDKEFWIIDKTGYLTDIYDKTTKGIKNGQPVFAKLKLEYKGKCNEGFAADYYGVYIVREILEIKPIK